MTPGRPGTPQPLPAYSNTASQDQGGSPWSLISQDMGYQVQKYYCYYFAKNGED
jgi:hypothetical protein